MEVALSTAPLTMASPLPSGSAMIPKLSQCPDTITVCCGRLAPGRIPATLRLAMRSRWTSKASDALAPCSL